MKNKGDFKNNKGSHLGNRYIYIFHKPPQHGANKITSQLSQLAKLPATV